MSQKEQENPKNEWKIAKCGRMRLSENYGEKEYFLVQQLEQPRAPSHAQ